MVLSFEEIKTRLENFASKLPFRDEDRLDFLQYAHEKILENPKRAYINYYFLYVDYLREMQGRELENYSLKARNLTYLGEDLNRFQDNKKMFDEMLCLDAAELELRKVGKEPRAFFILKYFFEFTEKEIAFVFNCSKSWVGLSLARAHKKLKANKVSTPGKNNNR